MKERPVLMLSETGVTTDKISDRMEDSLTTATTTTATKQTLKGQEKEGLHLHCDQMLVLQQNRTHTDQLQNQKSTKQNINMAYKGTQIQTPQQQDFCIG